MNDEKFCVLSEESECLRKLSSDVSEIKNELKDLKELFNNQFVNKNFDDLEPTKHFFRDKKNKVNKIKRIGNNKDRESNNSLAVQKSYLIFCIGFGVLFLYKNKEKLIF